MAILFLCLFRLRDEIQRDRVDTMPGVLRGKPFPLEYVAQVGLAIAANDLYPVSIRIRDPRYGSGYFVVEAGPAAMGVKLSGRVVQRRVAAPAHISTLLLVPVKFAGAGEFSAFVHDHPFFFRAQFIVLAFI